MDYRNPLIMFCHPYNSPDGEVKFLNHEGIEQFIKAKTDNHLWPSSVTTSGNEVTMPLFPNEAKLKDRYDDLIAEGEEHRDACIEILSPYAIDVLNAIRALRGFFITGDPTFTWLPRIAIYGLVVKFNMKSERTEVKND
jgi:hypothetical protein